MSDAPITSTKVKFFSGEDIPLELHKVRVVQKLHLRPVEDRLRAMQAAGFNTFQLTTMDVFLDMLTDSRHERDERQPDRVHAPRRRRVCRLAEFRAHGGGRPRGVRQAVRDPVHQGRAAENVISRAFIKQGDVIPMNYHFTTTKAHMEISGGRSSRSTRTSPEDQKQLPVQGEHGHRQAESLDQEHGAARIPFIRLEAPPT